MKIMFPAACEKCVVNVNIFKQYPKYLQKQNTNISTLFPPVGNH